MIKKICDVCGEKSHPRVKICKCGHKFAFKSKKKEKYTQANWKELVKGDVIKVSGGPFFLNSKEEKLSMGYKGKFCVSYLDENGIIAYGINDRGFCHIWMKNKKKTEHGIIKIPHKIKKIK